MDKTILATTDDEAPARLRAAFPSTIVQLDDHGRVPIGFAPARDSEMMTALEVAKALNVKQRWVTDNWRALNGYRLPGSNRLRFDWDEVVECLEQNGGE
jgi:hypothetical protein